MFCSLRCIYSLKEQGHVILYHYFWVKLFSSKDQNVRVLDVNDYIDNVSAESTTTRTRNVCTQFKFSFVPFIICFFSTYKTYPPFTCSQLLPWHLVSKKWTTTWTNNFREFLRELKSFVKPICQFILIKKGYKISGSVLIFITLFFDIILYKKNFLRLFL